MSEDGSPSRIASLIASPKTQKGVAINSVVAALALLASLFSSITFTTEVGSATVSLIPAGYTLGISIWASVSLIAMASNYYKKPFITPEVKKFNCHYCGAMMATSELICQNCRSKSSKGS